LIVYYYTREREREREMEGWRDGETEGSRKVL